MVVPIRAKLPCTYGHHHTGMGPHTRTVMFFDNLQLLLNIGPILVCSGYNTGIGIGFVKPIPSVLLLNVYF